VIGVLFNRVERCISFLKNGIDLGVAFGDVPLEERLYPCVGMRTPEEEARPPPRLPDARTRLRRMSPLGMRMRATASTDSCTAYVRAAVCRTARLPWCMWEAEAPRSWARHVHCLPAKLPCVALRASPGVVPQVEANFGATPFVGDFTGLLAECKERLRERVLAPPLPRRGKVRVRGGKPCPSRPSWLPVRMLASQPLIWYRDCVPWTRQSLSV
jgi:hypothetical protein